MRACALFPPLSHKEKTVNSSLTVRTSFACLLNAGTALLVLLLAVSASVAQVETTLARFDGITDGGAPYSPLIADSARNLYGTTTWNAYFDQKCFGFGSGTDCGTVFQLTPPQGTGGAWTETVLYRFSGGTDGAFPVGPLAMDMDGNLYGVTASGGGSADRGTVYELVRPVVPGDPWTEIILYAFEPGTGDSPNGVLFDASGNLFGATQFGGSCGSAGGNIFELSPPVVPGDPWTFQELYAFNCPGTSNDGIDPDGRLIRGPGGALYGTTQYSHSGPGTAYRLTPPSPGKTAWVEAILYRFQGGTDGSDPTAGLTENRGRLYGTTTDGGTCIFSNSGCGTVFELTPPSRANDPWAKKTIYEFQGGTDGKIPTWEVAFDRQGNLYGATYKGGNVSCRSNNQSACGTVYRLSRPQNENDPWTETILHAFVGVEDGMFPSSGVLIGHAGALYGTTSAGGDLNCSINDSKGCGVVYRIVP